jgi:hypothetical protein
LRLALTRGILHLPQSREPVLRQDRPRRPRSIATRDPIITAAMSFEPGRPSSLPFTQLCQAIRPPTPFLPPKTFFRLESPSSSCPSRLSHRPCPVSTLYSPPFYPVSVLPCALLHCCVHIALIPVCPLLRLALTRGFGVSPLQCWEVSCLVGDSWRHRRQNTHPTVP